MKWPCRSNQKKIQNKYKKTQKIQKNAKKHWGNRNNPAAWVVHLPMDKDDAVSKFTCKTMEQRAGVGICYSQNYPFVEEGTFLISGGWDNYKAPPGYHSSVRWWDPKNETW